MYCYRGRDVLYDEDKGEMGGYGCGAMLDGIGIDSHRSAL